MAYASRSGRAVTNPSSPNAFAVCQRCGTWVNRINLQNQPEWRGAALMPTYIFVCNRCMDVPQEQLRAIVVPADPVPVVMPFIEPFLADEMQGTSEPAEPYGRPIGLAQAAVMPLVGTVRYGVLLPVLSVTSAGGVTVTTTCSAPHGLATNGQVSAEGLSQRLANGFFSIVVTSATAFTYDCATAIPAGNLLTGATRIITCLVGLPLGVTTIPQLPA